MLTKIVTALFALVVSAMALPAAAQSGGYVEGRHYVRLNQPVKQVDPTKIEVALVFAFSSPHSFSFESAFQAWAKKQPTDVAIQRVHVMWNPQMEPITRAYYTAQALKIGDKVHMPIFNAFHLENKQRSLVTAEQWADFFAGYGVDKAKSLSTFNSFAVTSQVKQAEARVRGFKVTETPELVVGGVYRISPRLAGGHEPMLVIADFLVAKLRSERAGGQ